MKEELLERASAESDPTRRLSIAREYLQAVLLRSLHESEAFTSLSFVGGTALRFLYELPRFSEDLDFSVEDRTAYHPESWIAALRRELELGAYEANVTWKSSSTVHVGWVRVASVLQELGLAPFADQKLAVKMEIDTRPPEGARVERRVVNRHMLFVLQHHDLPSLMAGKLHALLTRTYLKGRDWYDLLWYLSRPVEPNTLLLENALRQTDSDKAVRASRWRKQLRERIQGIDEEALIRDVRPFLERPREADLLKQEHLLGLLTE